MVGVEVVMIEGAKSTFEIRTYKAWSGNSGAVTTETIRKKTADKILIEEKRNAGGSAVSDSIEIDSNRQDAKG